ncbi:unnamed protein product, partial [Owenia fusiformis]
SKMADTEKLLDALSRLRFHAIDSDWVKETWQQDYTSLDPLPIETEEDLQENGYHIETLCATVTLLKPWLQDKEGSRQGFWTVLVENELHHKNLVALLFYLMEVGSKRVSSVIQKEAGIVASELYLSLVTVPGSGAFKIFHPLLYQKALDYFKSLNSLSTSKRKHASSPIRSSQTGRSSQTARSQGGRRGKSRRKSQDKEPIRDAEESEDSDDEDEMTPQECSRLSSRLMSLLKTLVQLLQSYSLRQSEQSAQHTLQILVELTKQYPSMVDNQQFGKTLDVSRCKSVSQIAFMGISCLASELHGSVTSLCTSVFKQLLPCLLMLLGDNKSVAATTIPRDVQTIKDNALAYVLHILEEQGDRVLASARILLQHLCCKVPDKTEYRTRVAQAIVDIMYQLPGGAYAKIIEWLYKYSRNAKIGYRVFALDVSAALLTNKEKVLDDSVNQDQTMFLSHRFLIQMILSRCSDVAPTVRARAIVGFAQCSSSNEPGIRAAILDIVTPRLGRDGPGVGMAADKTPTGQGTTPDAQRIHTNIGTPGEQTNAEDATENTVRDATPAAGEKILEATIEKTVEGRIARQTPGSKSILLTPGLDLTLPDGQGVVSLLRRRATDEKVNVRKAALQALENIIKLDGEHFNIKDVKVLHERCQDPALSVRKQALISLTDVLLEMPHNKQIQSTWLDGVVPMVMDRETGAQEKCFEILEDVILSNIAPLHRSTGDQHKMLWSLMNIMASNEGVDLRRFLTKACQHWARVGKIKSSIVNSLETHVNTDHNPGVWLLLAEVCQSVGKFQPEFVLTYWRDHAKGASEEEYPVVQRVLQVIGSVAKHIKTDCIGPITDDLRKRLMMFNSPPELIAITINTLHKLCQAKSECVEDAKKTMDRWCGDLLKASDEYLSTAILSEQPDEDLNEDLVVRHLFTVGEVAQLCPDRTPKRIFMLVQSLVAKPCITTTDGSSQQVTTASQHTEPMLSQFSQMSQISQASSQDVLTQFSIKSSKVSSRIRAHAFVTLGKLCLQNEDIAKKCIAAMARELETCSDAAVRNNVIVIMCDLCVRYTNLTDQYIPNIAACLKDQSPLIRKQTLTLLTRLLQEDFLKWKGSLFFRYITSIVDQDQEIKQFAEFCLVHLLLVRHPTMFSQHFIESVYHFNAYDQHNVYNKFSQGDREKKMFSLKGPENCKKRMMIYKFMLEHMNDEQKFNLTGKICQDILGGVVDGVLALDANSNALLQDTLAILCCKEMKLASMKSKPQEDIVDQQDMQEAVMTAAKKTIITQIVKKNTIENIVPIIIALKHQLEQHRSPVLKDLMLYLREMMKDYKNEVKDIMAADKQLAKEIEFDLRMFEEQQAELERQRQPRSGSSTPQQVTPNQSPNPTKPKSPGLEKSPKDGATVPIVPPGIRSLGSPKSISNTPGRPMSMSTLAILNSARKAMEVAKQRTEGRTSPAAGGSPKATPKDVIASPRPTTRSPHRISTGSLNKENRQDSFKTPSRPNTRAISTPSGMIGNITFNPAEMTMLPPSPIAREGPQRIGISSMDNIGDRVPSSPMVTGIKRSEKDGKEVDLICMFSPDKPSPKPRQWNIRPPSLEKKAAKPIKTDTDDSITDDVEFSTLTRKSTRSKTRHKKK